MTRALHVRDARPADLEGLTAICYADHPAIHRDRLQDAASGHLRFLVAKRDGQIVGFGLLVFSRPATWPDAGTTDHLPGIMDLYVDAPHRGQRIGTTIVQHMEGIAASGGYGKLYLSVDPQQNFRAYALYTRLGYRALQTEPYCERWRFVDSDGCVHEGEEWLVDMVKTL
jgi:GNAT superfamily N-acetyltransferase